MVNRVALVIPWSGERPWYWDLWRQSAVGMPFDVIAIERPLNYFETLINKKINLSLSTPRIVPASQLAPPIFLHLSSSYKLCDFKPLYGEIFADALKGYDYWAFGDCDVIYGAKMCAWIRKVLDGGYDIATVQGEFTAGPFTILRNCAEINRLWKKAANVENPLGERRVVSFDELGPNWFRRKIYGRMSFAALREAADCFSAVVWRESAAGRIKLLAETVIDEHALRRGEEVKAGGDYVLYHFIGTKGKFGFTGDAHGVRVSRGWPWWRDALGFAGALLRGKATAWYRVSDCLRCRLDKLSVALFKRHLFPNWWRDFTWNNR